MWKFEYSFLSLGIRQKSFLILASKFTLGSWLVGQTEYSVTKNIRVSSSILMVFLFQAVPQLLWTRRRVPNQRSRKRPLKTSVRPSVQLLGSRRGGEHLGPVWTTGLHRWSLLQRTSKSPTRHPMAYNSTLYSCRHTHTGQRRFLHRGGSRWLWNWLEHPSIWVAAQLDRNPGGTEPNDLPKRVQQATQGLVLSNYPNV